MYCQERNASYLAHEKESKEENKKIKKKFVVKRFSCSTNLQWPMPMDSDCEHTLEK